MITGRVHLPKTENLEEEKGWKPGSLTMRHSKISPVARTLETPDWRPGSITTQLGKLQAQTVARSKRFYDWQHWKLNLMAYICGDQSNQMAWAHNFGDEGFYKSSNNMAEAELYSKYYSHLYMKDRKRRPFNIADHTCVSGAELVRIMVRIGRWFMEEKPDDVEDHKQLDEFIRSKPKLFKQAPPLPFTPGTPIFVEELNNAFKETSSYAASTPTALLKLIRSFRPCFFTNSQTFSNGALSNLLFHHVHFRTEMARKNKEMNRPICSVMVRVRRMDAKWFVYPLKAKFIGGKFVIPRHLNPDNYNYGIEYIGDICSTNIWNEYKKTKGQHQLLAFFTGYEQVVSREKKRGHGTIAGIQRKLAGTDEGTDEEEQKPAQEVPARPGRRVMTAEAVRERIMAAMERAGIQRPVSLPNKYVGDEEE